MPQVPIFELTDRAIDCEQLKEALRDDRAGALITFEGVVRNHNEGKKVRALSYEGYEPLARAEALRIFAEAQERYQIIKCLAVHRVGELAIGEAAVFLGVAAAHRDQAYQASRYIIDEIKKRLPIWKKEHYLDGSADWVNCSHGHDQEREYEHKPQLAGGK
ncbi:MAG: molybdenum cofactor biosynthesis protein MoaE [Cyanobacteria bacterium REEB67]|nr:molybdenum cofactor biosynthesis protein MoaE [Cyanobacteria bacterium REEB67]